MKLLRTFAGAVATAALLSLTGCDADTMGAVGQGLNGAAAAYGAPPAPTGNQYRDEVLDKNYQLQQQFNPGDDPTVDALNALNQNNQ